MRRFKGVSRALAAVAIVLPGAIVGCSLLVDTDGLSTEADTADASDAATDVGPSSDAPASDGAADADAQPLRMCDPLAPFEQLRPLEVPSDSSPFKVTLTDDELEVWFSQNSATDAAAPSSMAHGRRSALDASFTYTVEPNVSDGLDPGVSGDGLRMVYVTYGPIGALDLFLARRNDRTSVFAKGLVLANVSSSRYEIAPFLAGDGVLWFGSDVAVDTGVQSIYRAEPQGGVYGPPVAVPELSNGFGDTGIVITRDGLVAYVTSARPAPMSLGGIDIFRATRASTSAPFGALSNVTEVNSAARDRATWISRDGCRLYLESDRGPGLKLYVAERSLPPL